MSKKETFEEETSPLNEKIMDEFADRLEKAINKVCEKHPDIDPRLELLITLGSFAAQVGIDCGYDKKDFLLLAGELYDDLNESEDAPMDKSKVN